jgi:hypothetical protein
LVVLRGAIVFRRFRRLPDRRGPGAVQLLLYVAISENDSHVQSGTV